jgi:hypothetical protein
MSEINSLNKGSCRDFLSDNMWTMKMTDTASIIYLWFVFSRSLRETVMIGIWAFVAISARHWNEILVYYCRTCWRGNIACCCIMAWI